MQDMYDESMADIDRVKNNVTEFLQYAEKLKEKFSPPKENLTGQFSDLAECKNGLSKTSIDMLDPAKKEQLLKNLERAEKQGLIEVDFENKNIRLTAKGEEYVKNPSFQAERAKDLRELNGVTVQQLGVELDCTEKDLNYFRTNSELNLGAIKFDGVSAETQTKFAENMQKLKSDGLVSETNGVFKLTGKGNNFINSAEFAEKFSAEKFAEKAIAAIPAGRVAVVLKEVATVAATAQTAKSAAQAMGG